MVAITGGQGLGVNLGLAGVLGDRGLAGQAQAGRNGQRVYVNGSTGNLVVQTQDEQLFDHGLDPGVTRTYNSQGQLVGNATDNPGTGLYARRVELVDGDLGSDGSTLRRTTRDGVQAVYRKAAESAVYLPGTAGAAGSHLHLNARLRTRTGPERREHPHRGVRGRYPDRQLRQRQQQ